jgi:hypothetical protein
VIDRQVILWIIMMLGGQGFILVAGLVYTSISGKQLDAGLSALAGSVVGYLGGILTNVSRARQDPNTATLTMPAAPATTASLQVSQEPEPNKPEGT